MYTVQCTHVCYSTLSELSKNIPDYRYFVIVNIGWISRVEGKPFFWAKKNMMGKGDYVMLQGKESHDADLQDLLRGAGQGSRLHHREVQVSPVKQCSGYR